jgi:glucose/arabinose dehydrogenase
MYELFNSNHLFDPKHTSSAGLNNATYAEGSSTNLAGNFIDSLNTGLMNRSYNSDQNHFIPNSSIQSAAPLNLLFIDRGVKDYAGLAIAAAAGTEVIFLDSYIDGISQISEVLAGRQNIASLQIVSHGRSGGIQLGNTFYTLQSLSDRQTELQSWAGALVIDADILLYGCNIAADESGLQFIQTLSNFTGADIAASNDLTGNSAFGGDWDLEIEIGAIHAQLAFQSAALQLYEGTLPYLSDLSWTSMSNGWGPAERDLANGENGVGDGGPLRLNGVTYTKGLGVHAASDITFALNGAYVRFTSDIGVDDAVGSSGSVVFQVFADGTQLYDSGLMTGSTATRTVDVDLTGRQNLRLVVTNGGDPPATANWYDHANWADAQLFAPVGPDTTAPTAVATLSNVAVSGAATYDFTVTYSDSQAVNVSTIDGSDVRVTGPNSFSQLASLVSVTPTGNGPTRTATYRITTPGGSWDLADNGTYTVVLQANQVNDTSGNEIAASTLGTFQVNAQNFVYLSDLNWTSATNGWGPVERDLANGDNGAGDGSPLQLNGVTYTKGLGVHASSDITYALNGAYTRFTADVGVDDGVGSSGSVIFQVFADGIQLYESGLMTGSTATRTLDVDLTGRQNLRLVVTGAGDGIDFDHASWADARLVAVPVTPDTTAPTASATVANLTTGGAGTYDFTVTYSDDRSINSSTIDGSDVLVTGPNDFNQLASLVSVSPTSNGSPRTATYRITAPGGSWDPADNGTYTVALQANQVSDTSGNAVPAAASLATFTVNVTPPPPDTTAPTATLTATTLDTSRSTPYTFTVNYADVTAVNVSTINSSDVRVTGPNGYSQLAQLVSVTPNSNGSPLTATYQIAAPDGIWNWNDRGTYTATLLAGEVRDTLENTASTDTTLGTFQVTVASTIVVGTNSSQVVEGGSVTIPIQRTGDTTGTATINYFTGGNSTAVANVHYVPIPVSTLTFAPGETVKNVMVQTLNDGAPDTNRTVSLLIETPTGADLGPSRTSSISIVDQATPVRTYLSDLNWTSMTNGWGSAERDRANGENGVGDGGAITLNGVTYAKGLGVHAGSELIYNLGGAYNSFFAYIGVDDAVGSQGSVVFQIWADGIQLFDSGVMTGDSATQLANVNVTGRQTLRLVVTNGGDSPATANWYDHANWADAQLVAGSYTPPPPTTPPAPPPPTGTISRERVVGDLNQPTTFDWTPDGRLMFIAEKGGAVRVFVNSVSSTPQFSTVQQYATGINAHGVTAVDLNGDGRLDLAVANSGSDSVSVLFGNGNGTFTTATNYGVGDEPKSVFAADFDGDGDLDLVTANQATNNVSFLRNNGNGTFATSVSYTASPGAHEVMAGDIDADGDIDIAVTGWGASIVTVLRNNGNGTFSNRADYNVGSAPHSLQLADFNGDNRPDLAVANRSSDNVSVLLNTGTGAFANAINYSVAARPHSIRSADLNNDGNIDLVTDSDLDSVSVLLGNGNGGFGSSVSYAAGRVPNGLAIGDVNSDGNLDLLTANNAGNYPSGNNPGGDTINVLLGNGNGTFADPTTFTTGRTPFDLTLADFNGDGKLDVATANWHTNDVGVLLNTTVTGLPGNLTPGLQVTPFIDISAQVNNVADRGLLGMEIDPFFGQNQGRDYIYLLFTYDPPETAGRTGFEGPDGAGNRPARLIRVTANPATNYTTALPGSEVILLGSNSLWQYTSRPDQDSTDNFDLLPSGIVNGTTITAPTNLIEDPDSPNIGRDYSATDTDFDRNNNIRDYLAGDSQSHSIGQIQFGLDGMLYVTVGDGTSYNGVDWRSTRVQDIDNLSGKLLRIDPLTGRGLTDNPFYNGDLDSNRSKVWSLGLRNSFRFTINPQTGAPVLADVGWNNWEELNVATRGGNLGWPYFEGTPQNVGYSSLPQAQAFYNSGQPVISPFYTRNHAASQNPDGRAATAFIMGDFYTGNTLPATYNGALFYNDVGLGYVYAAFLNADGTVSSTQVFDNLQYIVDMETGPDGYLYYASLYGGEIGRWEPA